MVGPDRLDLSITDRLVLPEGQRTRGPVEILHRLKQLVADQQIETGIEWVRAEVGSLMGLDPPLLDRCCGKTRSPLASTLKGGVAPRQEEGSRCCVRCGVRHVNLRPVR